MPAENPRLQSEASEATVSMARGSRAASLKDLVALPLAPLHLVPRFRQHWAEHRLDLLELLGVADQRRRQLDHGVAAVVRTTDQAAPVQLAREEAAQEPLRLLAREPLLRLLV